MLQLISGISKLRVAGAENYAFRSWAQEYARQREISFRVGSIRNTVTVFNGAFPIFASFAIFALLASSGDNPGAPALTTGEFIAFSAAFGMFVGAMLSMSDAALDLLQAMPFYERLAPVLTQPVEVDEGKSYPGGLSGSIELSRLRFRYEEEGPWVLDDLSLRIEAGQFVAFVGASGCGKSTLMRLMIGFDQPEVGTIYFDGQDLDDLDVREVRQQMGVVLAREPGAAYRHLPEHHRHHLSINGRGLACRGHGWPGRGREANADGHAHLRQRRRQRSVRRPTPTSPDRASTGHPSPNRVHGRSDERSWTTSHRRS